MEYKQRFNVYWILFSTIVFSDLYECDFLDSLQYTNNKGDAREI